MKRILLLLAMTMGGSSLVWSNTIEVAEGDMGELQQTESGYVPMLENGKEWHYNCISQFLRDYPETYPETPSEIQEMLKIEGVKTIDGVEYYCLNLYHDKERTADASNPIAYLREDVTAMRVYTRPNLDYFDYRDYFVGWMLNEYGYQQPDGKMRGIGAEKILYDFSTPVQSQALCNFERELPTDILIEGEFQSRRAIYLQDDYGKNICMVEGMGLMYLGACIGWHGPAPHLLGIQEEILMTSDPIEHWWIPYEIIDGSGNQIYQNATFAPNSFDALRDIFNVSRISINDGAIYVQSEKPSNCTLNDMQGRMISEQKLSIGSNVVKTRNLTPGIYILKTEGVSYKIHIK